VHAVRPDDGEFPILREASRVDGSIAERGKPT